MAKVRLYWRGTRADLDWAEGGERFRRSIGEPDAREAERIRGAKEAELTHGARILARLPKVLDYLEVSGLVQGRAPDDHHESPQRGEAFH